MVGLKEDDFVIMLTIGRAHQPSVDLDFAFEDA